MRQTSTIYDDMFNTTPLPLFLVHRRLLIAMSDDFDDLPDDDLFTNPASLAAIEQAVVSAEQNARTQGNVQSTGRRPQQQQVNGALGLGGGMGIRKPDGKYHHSVTLAGSSNLRGRGSGASSSCSAGLLSF